MHIKTNVFTHFHTIQQSKLTLVLLKPSLNTAWPVVSK